jgi:hypothetical protein
MYIFLGILNITLLAVMTSPLWLRVLNNNTLRLKGGTYGKVIKFLRAIHKPLGALILIIAAVHGYLALGVLRLHTGTILWLAIFITAGMGLSFYLFKKKSLFVWHKRMVLVVIVLLLVHLFFPNAVYYLMK